jgi:hypothetical protein
MSIQKPENAAKKPETVKAKLRFLMSKTPVRRPVMWLRHRGLRPADIFFSTYPRSGTTWTRFTMFEILTGENATFESVNSLMLGVGMHDRARSVLPNGGRLIGTHEGFRKEYKRSIYLLRDVRDVILSEYAFMTALDRFHGDMDQFLKAFFKGKVTGYGSWPRHVASWLECPYYGTDDLLILRYEDLRRDPEAGFTKMLRFGGLERDPEQIRRAIANNSVEQMRAKELQSPRKASVRGQFIRTGKVGGWAGKFTPEQLDTIDYHAGDVMDRMGYERGSASASALHNEPILAAKR